jgi:hypothetical protein
MCGSQDEIAEIDDDESVACDGVEHPWHGINFDNELMEEF